MSRAGLCRPLERGSHKLTRPGVPPTRPYAPRPFPRPEGAPLSLVFPGSQSSSGPRLPVLSRPAEKATRRGARWAPRRPAAGGSGKGGQRGSPALPRRQDRGAGSQKRRGHIKGGASWAGLVGGSKS